MSLKTQDYKIPKWLLKQEGLTTKRQWKSKKRQQLKATLKALDEYNMGCAYTPGYSDIDTIRKLLKKVQTGLSIKRWGQ